MKELQDIIDAFAGARIERTPAVLATVVRTSGSTYRRPGARMLITQDGRTVGSVSGGCLERNVVRQAQRVFQSHAARLVTYDSMEEDDAEWSFGLGCNGIVDVLFEHLPENGNVRQMEFLARCVQRRRDGVLAKIFAVEGDVDANAGDFLLVRPDSPLEDDIADADLRDAMVADAWCVYESGVSETKVYETAEGRVHAFIESIQPSVPLTIFGGGHDAVPLARLAKELGWHVTVVDGRPGYATKARFIAADEVVPARPDAIDDRVTLDGRTVAVIMNHNYLDDRAVLRTLLAAPIRYIGVLGPKRRTLQMLDDLKAEGAAVRPERLAALYGPVGLDIGADTPEEIAFAILGEIKAILAGRSGGLSRDREGPLHGEAPRGHGAKLAGNRDGEDLRATPSREVA